ncbi:MAG TPA: hypothetical protein H9837_01670, partial [Candidatus Brachybacterium merdigallinarum]|nr:hypothetical protein [Candidatus Brachybacterium merdigallinarum]
MNTDRGDSSGVSGGDSGTVLAVTDASPAAAFGPDVLGVRSRGRRSAVILTVLAIVTTLSLVVCMGIGPVPIAPGITAQVIAQHLGLSVPVTWEASTDSIV